MSYTVLSWNVEKFSYEDTHVPRVIHHISTRNPDIFGLYEVTDADIYPLMRDRFPQYTIFITGGRQSQEILVAVRNGKFDHVSFEQRTEFREGNEYLRPGALLSVVSGQRTDTLLFLHTDSGTEASAFGNRARMLGHGFSLKTRLDQLVGAKANFLILGDLNTMGLEYPRRIQAHIRVTEPEEIAGLDEWARTFRKRRRGKANMFLLRKNQSVTWTSSSGRDQSDLDQVVAGDHMQFRSVGTDAEGNEAQVRVEGWIGLHGSEFTDFVNNVSDHNSLFFEVMD